MLLEWLTHTAAREYVVRSVLHIHAVVHRVLADLVVGPRQHVQSARTVAPARNVVAPRFNQAERVHPRPGALGRGRAQCSLIMLAVLLVYQQIENNILTPKIQGAAVNLSGFFIIIAVTLFGALLGVLGALTAVPLAATIQIFVQELTKARREQVAEAREALEAAEVQGRGLLPT